MSNCQSFLRLSCESILLFLSNTDSHLPECLGSHAHEFHILGRRPPLNAPFFRPLRLGFPASSGFGESRSCSGNNWEDLVGKAVTPSLGSISYSTLVITFPICPPNCIKHESIMSPLYLGIWHDLPFFRRIDHLEPKFSDCTFDQETLWLIDDS